MAPVLRGVTDLLCHCVYGAAACWPQGNFMFDAAKHPDFLGAILGTGGCARRMFGIWEACGGRICKGGYIWGSASARMARHILVYLA